jgi:putative phosphoribosyl transferase
MIEPELPDLLTDHLAEPVIIPAGAVRLPGTLTLPGYPLGVVVFAHGSGSSRFSPRNRLVADRLVAANLGTLLFDLLTPAEADVRANVFDIALLADRLRAATEWLAARPATADLSVGYFGASTGAAAALVAAARAAIGAVVSRGGRPDLAGDALGRVTAPTLLIVGGLDAAVLELNRQALMRLDGVRQLAVVPRATHLFEEPGALEHAALLATRWFERYLGAPPSRREAKAAFSQGADAEGRAPLTNPARGDASAAASRAPHP